MKPENEIAGYLEKYHSGERTVVSSRELETAFQIRGPDLRRIINSLRGQGIPICSTQSGYYFAATKEELEHTVRQLRSRICSIAHAGRGLARTLAACGDPNQLTLPMGGDTA